MFPETILFATESTTVPSKQRQQHQRKQKRKETIKKRQRGHCYSSNDGYQDKGIQERYQGQEKQREIKEEEKTKKKGLETSIHSQIIEPLCIE